MRTLLTFAAILGVVPCGAYAGTISGTVTLVNGTGDNSGVFVQAVFLSTNIPTSGFWGVVFLAALVSVSLLLFPKGRKTGAVLGVAILVLGGVRLAWPDSSAQAYTDKNGNFSLTGLDAGSYGISCYKSCYLPGTTTVVTDADGNFSGVSITLQPDITAITPTPSPSPAPLPTLNFSGCQAANCSQLPTGADAAPSFCAMYPSGVIYPGCGFEAGLSFCCGNTSDVGVFGFSTNTTTPPVSCGKEVQILKVCTGDPGNITFDVNSAQAVRILGSGCTGSLWVYARYGAPVINSGREFFPITHVYQGVDYNLVVPAAQVRVGGTGITLAAELPAKLPYQTLRVIAKNTETDLETEVAVVVNGVVTGTVPGQGRVVLKTGWDGSPLQGGNYAVRLEVGYPGPIGGTPYIASTKYISVVNTDVDMYCAAFSSANTTSTCDPTEPLCCPIACFDANRASTFYVRISGIRTPTPVPTITVNVYNEGGAPIGTPVSFSSSDVTWRSDLNEAAVGPIRMYYGSSAPDALYHYVLIPPSAISLIGSTVRITAGALGGQNRSVAGCSDLQVSMGADKQFKISLVAGPAYAITNGSEDKNVHVANITVVNDAGQSNWEGEMEGNGLFHALRAGSVTVTVNVGGVVGSTILEVKRPNSLGTTHNQYDQIIFNACQLYGAQGPLVKAMIQEESSFISNSFRYEPGQDYDLISNPKNSSHYKLTTSHYSSYRLAVPAENGHSPLSQGSLLIPADISPRNIYTLIDDNGNGYYSAEEIYNHNSPSPPWPVPGIRDYNFTAQTTISSSYGPMQIIWFTALNPMKWNNGNGDNPSKLLDANVNIPLAVGYLTKLYAQNYDPDANWTANWNTALYYYNNQNASYPALVRQYEPNYPPVPNH